jgi:hypothetical protein
LVVGFAQVLAHAIAAVDIGIPRAPCELPAAQAARRAGKFQIRHDPLPSWHGLNTYAAADDFASP